MSEKIHLATWHGGGTFRAWDEDFVHGVQREVSAGFAQKMKNYPNLDIVHTEEGSKEDVRVSEYVVPVQATGEPEKKPETPKIDPTPKAKEKQ